MKKKPWKVLAHRKTQGIFYRTVIDAALPIITNVGSPKCGVHHRDIPYHEHEGVRMHLDVYSPDTPGPHPVLVSYHGGGWTLGRRHNLQRVGQYFARHGYVVFNCSYRLAPQFRFPAGIQDALCALRWVYHHAADYGGDATRIGVWGDSAGGHLSAMMAVGQQAVHIQPECECAPQKDVPIGAAVHYYGVFDFARFMRFQVPLVRTLVRTALGEREVQPDFLTSISPERLAQKGRVPPTLLICGGRDPLIIESKRYYKKLTSLEADVQLKVYPKAIHGFLNLWWTKESKHSIRLALDHFNRFLMPVVGEKAA